MGHELVIMPGEVIALPRFLWSESSTGMVIRELLRKRRSSFAYCRFCRPLTPPEYRWELDVGMGCAARWRGVIY